MAKFQFRLDSLLRVRVAERERLQALLAEAFAAQDALETKHTALDRELRAEHGRARADAAPGALDVARLTSARRYAAEITAQIAALESDQRALAEVINDRRQAVVEANRQVRVLEKLRDHQHQQFRGEQARADAKRLDEIAARVAGQQQIV